MPEATSEPAESSPFWSALGAVQAELPVIGADKTGQAGNHKYKYAPLDTIWPKILPALSKHKLAWSCQPTMLGDKFVMQYGLMHTPSGDGVTGFYPLPDGRPQDIGSALTYARRYALCAALGLVVKGDDDDGQRAQTRREDVPRQAVMGPSEPVPDPNENVSVALALIGHVASMDDLRVAWTEVGRMGLQRNAEVIAAKNQRKEELA